MKQFSQTLLSAGGSLAILTSCMSAKVGSGNNYDFSVLKPGSHYQVKLKNGDTISGFNFIQSSAYAVEGEAGGKKITVEKADVMKISKVSMGKTIPLAAGIVAAAILIPAYAKNKPVGQ